jgi:hypothetical protein
VYARVVTCVVFLMWIWLFGCLSYRVPVSQQASGCVSLSCQMHVHISVFTDPPPFRTPWSYCSIALWCPSPRMRFFFFSLSVCLVCCSPGPNSPLQWLPHIVDYLIPPEVRTPERLNKLILGTNFYGYRWNTQGGREAVLASQLIELLEAEQVEISYDEQHAEHSFRVVSNGDVVYFPSLWVGVETRELLATLPLLLKS